ncbi:unnamed protein product [Arctia plantaginis]|nr:unnamed protein product [Arctia plantaginis]
MEKPKMKKGNRQNTSPDACCASWYTKPTPITPKRCHNVSKVPNLRQAGDARRQGEQKNLAQMAMHLKYGRFNNQPNFTRPGRPRQKLEANCILINAPKRSQTLKSNIIKNSEGFKSEQEFLAQKSDKLYHHLSLSEVMHIDIRPPRNTKASSPVHWTSLMNAKYKPSRALSPRRG